MVSPHRPHSRADAEAAAWIARLNSPERSEATEAALRAWLGDGEAHREAFERATELWNIIPGAVRQNDRLATSSAVVGTGRKGAERARPRRAPALALAASLLLMLGAGGWWLETRPVGYSTRAGEQEVATLEDGTRIALNTDTEVRVSFAKDRRHIRLDHGEAMFEVAHNPRRPFVVTAGGKTVTAIGTSFIVRNIKGEVAVTLIQGKVAVAGPAISSAAGAAILEPGERLTVSADAPASIDQPPIEAATAWRRGQAIFSDTPLSAAVAELNRYGGRRIAIADPRLASLSVSGVFATNDTAEFASAVASLHGLRVEQRGGELRIVP